MRTRGGLACLCAAVSISALLSGCANYAQSEKAVAPPTNIDVNISKSDQNSGLSAETEQTETVVTDAGIDTARTDKPDPVIATDEPISDDLLSLNFKEIGIRPLLEMLSDGGENFRFLLYPEAATVRVRGLSLKDVTWREALKVTIKLHNLTMVEEDGLIVINTHENFVAEKEREAERANLAMTGKRSSRSFRLNYTQPEEVKEYLDKIFGVTAGLTSGQVVSRSFKRAGAGVNLTFSIFPKASIITAYGPEIILEEVARRVAEIDIPQKQVFIEARIVDILKNYSRSLGVQWGGRYNAITDRVFPASVSLSGGGATNGVVNFPATDLTNAGVIPAAVALALADSAGTALINMQLSALEQEGKSKTLSNPKIITINGVMAKVESGREIPYQTTSANLGTQTEFKKAVISLEVTPFITPDNMINMKIIAKKEDADFTNQVLNVPSILTRVVQTTVIVQDGGTAVLGGVFENIKANTDTGTPGLANIPLIGWLFKSRDKIDNEKEFLIFITPHIIKGRLPSTVSKNTAR